jgi:hypothetical protein
MSRVVKFPIIGKSFHFTKLWKNEFFWKKISRFASFGGFTYAPHKYVRLSTIGVEIYMISSNLNFFEVLIFRQGGVYWRFREELDFSKMAQTHSSKYNVFLNLIYKVSKSGVLEFPIFEDSFMFTKFWKNESFWKKSPVF